MNALDLLNKWFKITKFEKDKKEYNLLDIDSYEIQKTNEFILKICNVFDNTGLIPLIYIKNFSDNYFKNLKVSMLDIFQNKYQDIHILKEFYDELQSDEVKNIEKELSNKLKELSSLVCSKKYLDNNEYCIDGLEFVINNITKLRIDIFKKGGEIQPFRRISKSVHHFNSLADCLLSLENAEDGIYLCYISNGISIDGYFGYFIKSNGNIFSVNERLDECYIGQHSFLRNNRYTENKLYELFPYEIIDFKGEDYKGYATSLIIDDDKLSFENFKTSTFNCIILTMYLLSKKYVGKTLDGDILYVNSLLKQNMKSLKNSNNEIELYNKSDIIKFNHSFEIKINEEKFLNGELCNKFNNNGNHFSNINQILVDLYGNDFNFQEAYKDILVSDKTKLLTSENNTQNKFNNEFIGNEYKFQVQGFYELRNKLAFHIKQKMLNEYQNFGGKKALQEWWRNIIINNYEKLKLICRDVYNDESKGCYDIVINRMFNERSKLSIQTVTKFTKEEMDTNYNSMLLNCKNNLINEIKDNNASKYTYLDLDDKHTCTYFFVFKPYNWKHIEDMFNIELPKFVKGWYNSGSYETPYYGNPLLDVVDPVDRIDSILNSKNSEYKFNFNFFIGFSTFNMKKILK